MLFVQIHGEVVGYLTTGGDDDTMRLFQVNDVQYALKRQLVKVQAVAHIIVRRDRFRIIVDHDGTPTFLADGVQRLYATPVELDTRSNAIGARAQHDDAPLVVLVLNVVCCS